MMELWSTFIERQDTLWNTLVEHMQLSLISLFIAVLIAVPLGIILTKFKSIAEIVINITAIMQTIPSLAILGLMIPLFGIGKVPAIIALVIYALLPILRNTYTGIKEVDPSLIEAARGIGMNNRRRLLQVELPLAMPVVMAGIRTSMVLIIGTATLAALIGAGGLGDLILLGIDRNDTSLILLGAIPAAVLAIVFDLILRWLQHRSFKTMMIALLSFIVTIALTMLIMFAFNKDKDVVIAGKLGAEPEIITSMYKQLIEEKTDYNVEVKPGLGKTSFLFKALQNDDIDGYLEFTGTVLATFTEETPTSNDEQAVYEQANKALQKEYNMTMLEPMKFNNTYALAVKKEYAKKHELKTISDLKKVEDEIKVGFTLEFNDREDGYKGIQKEYNLNFEEVNTMEPKIRYQAIESGDIDLIDAYATDGELEKYNMVVLEDDQKLFPPYQGAPLFKEGFIKDNPEIKEALNQLAGKITQEEMQTMNYRVGIEGADASSVSEEFLKSKGLVD